MYGTDFTENVSRISIEGKCMYKYSEKRFNSALVKMGCIRIGTLHDFRKSEHKLGIADFHEGKKKVFHSINKGVLGNGSVHDQASKAFGAMGVIGGSVICEDVTFTKTFDAPDCFILCTSSICSQFVMDEFEDADSCVEINDISLFYHELTLTLNAITPVVFRGFYEINYQDKKEPWNGQDWGDNPALIKEPEFIKQHEVRAIWQPRLNKPIKPLILSSSILGSACREITI